MRNLRSAEEVERGGLRGIREKIDDDAERKPQVGKGEPGKDEGENIILQVEMQVSVILDSRFVEPKQEEGIHTNAWMWKKNIRMIPWPDLYMLKK